MARIHGDLRGPELFVHNYGLRSSVPRADVEPARVGGRKADLADLKWLTCKSKGKSAGKAGTFFP